MAKREEQKQVEVTLANGEKRSVSIPKLARFIAPVTEDLLVAARAYEIDNDLSETALVAKAVSHYINTVGVTIKFDGDILPKGTGKRGPAKKYSTPEEAKKARAAANRENARLKSALASEIAKINPELLEQIKAQLAAADEAKKTAPATSTKK